MFLTAKTPRLCLIAAVAGLAGCAGMPIPGQPVPQPRLHDAWAEMKQAVDINADAVDADDMNHARDLYRRAYALRDDDPATAARLAEESQTLAALAEARTQASIAAQQRQSAQASVTALERMAHPAGAPR